MTNIFFLKIFPSENKGGAPGAPPWICYCHIGLLLIIDTMYISPSQPNVSAVSDSDVGDQAYRLCSSILTDFQYVIDLPLFPTSEWQPVHKRFPLSTSCSFFSDHPGQRDRFQLILSHDVSHKSDLSVNNNLHEISWCIGSLKHFSFDTLSVHAIRNITTFL